MGTAAFSMGQKIFDARKKKRLGQQELAELLQCSRQALSRWENDRQRPSSDLLVKLSEALDVTPSFLLGENSNTFSNSTIDHSIINNAPVSGSVQTVNTARDTVSPAGGSSSETAPVSPNGIQSVRFVTREDVIMIPVISSTGSFSDGRRFSLPIDELAKMGNVDPDTLFAFVVPDDMMIPYLAAGDYAVCEKTQAVIPGQLVVITLYGSCVVRGIRTDGAHIHTLVVGNRTYTDTPITEDNRAQLNVIGRVLRIFHPSVAPGVLM